MFDKHSNANIQIEVNASPALQKAVETTLSDAQDQLRQAFQKEFGIPVPSAADALVLQADSSLQYASASLISEYTDGVSELIGPLLDGDYPNAALAVVQLVSATLDNIVGISTISGMQQFESVKTVDGETPIVSALMVASAAFSTRDWKISRDFCACSYLLVVFVDPTSTLARR